jgi:hypothetical protein
MKEKALVVCVTLLCVDTSRSLGWEDYKQGCVIRRVGQNHKYIL